MPIVLTTYPAADFNSYASLDFFKDRLALQLRVTTGKTDDQLMAALIAATEYADVRHAYRGYRALKDQEREFPREECYDARGDKVEGVPLALQKATCEYAWRELNSPGVLMPDPTWDASGQVVKSKDEKVGPISESVTYETNRGVRLPVFPQADNFLYAAGIIRRPAGFSVGTLVRG